MMINSLFIPDPDDDKKPRFRSDIEQDDSANLTFDQVEDGLGDIAAPEDDRGGD